MKTNTLIAVVAKSGVGKSTLILEVVKRFPDRLAIVKSLTTRPSRGAEDEPFYEHVSREEFRRRRDANRILQSTEYAGNLYGNDREHVEAILSHRVGISALVEPSVIRFRELSYDVRVVKIIAAEGGVNRGDARNAADAARAKTELPADLTIVNSFTPGGKERACDELAAFVQTLFA